MPIITVLPGPSTSVLGTAIRARCSAWMWPPHFERITLRKAWANMERMMCRYQPLYWHMWPSPVLQGYPRAFSAPGLPSRLWEGTVPRPDRSARPVWHSSGTPLFGSPPDPPSRNTSVRLRPRRLGRAAVTVVHELTWAYFPLPFRAAYSVCRETPRSRATMALGTSWSTRLRASWICSGVSFRTRS